MWIINPGEVVFELYSHHLPPEILLHSFLNVDKKCLLSKLYGHIYYAAKTSGTDGLKIKTKLSNVFAERI